MYICILSCGLPQTEEKLGISTERKKDIYSNVLSADNIANMSACVLKRLFFSNFPRVEVCSFGHLLSNFLFSVCFFFQLLSP